MEGLEEDIPLGWTEDAAGDLLEEGSLVIVSLGEEAKKATWREAPMGKEAKKATWREAPMGEEAKKATWRGAPMGAEAKKATRRGTPMGEETEMDLTEKETTEAKARGVDLREMEVAARAETKVDRREEPTVDAKVWEAVMLEVATQLSVR